VPPEARWAYLKGQAPQPTIGQLVDDAMSAIERDNPSLKGVLPKDFARPGLDKQRLGQIINLVSDVALGAPADRSKDTLGRVYEYFLSRFASAEGKSGGQFYTPRQVVRVLVEMLAPYTGRVYDPCCGSGGMFVQSETFIAAHANGNGNGGRGNADISIFGQESNYTTWRLARMNLAIRGIDAQIAHGDCTRAPESRSANGGDRGRLSQADQGRCAVISRAESRPASPVGGWRDRRVPPERRFDRRRPGARHRLRQRRQQQLVSSESVHRWRGPAHKAP
jgi:type I restriction-modification system DNA methylase subunit